ncbi:hypothetical protein OIU84_026557 [Salix udensis]|uniref:Glycine-rich protein n=1 Tax=Salix udensis TaxID=889485 RepID=A0AAD6PEV0_9ROSI|nr:hypothetical protein OIU84_026557 [Salix udensis]
MNWVARRKEMGVLGRELVCFYLLLLLIMSQLEAPCYAAGYGRFGSSNGGSISELKNSPARSANIGGLKGNADKDGGEIFGAEKRKVYTGPKSSTQQISYYSTKLEFCSSYKIFCSLFSFFCFPSFLPFSEHFEAFAGKLHCKCFK